MYLNENHERGFVGHILKSPSYYLWDNHKKNGLGGIKKRLHFKVSIVVKVVLL